MYGITHSMDFAKKCSLRIENVHSCRNFINDIQEIFRLKQKPLSHTPGTITLYEEKKTVIVRVICPSE